jgi:hypothetical protein
MLGWTIAILALLVLAFLVWKHYGHLLLSEGAEFPIEMPEPPVEQHLRVELVLPSALPALKFKCWVTIDFIVGAGFPVDQDPAEVAKWEILQTARAISAQYSLTVHEYLHMALNHQLHQARDTAKGRLTVRAHAEPANVDIKELGLARKLEQTQFELEIEEHLEGARMRRAERLGRLIAEPQQAALWWFANHPDRIQDLPRITETMFALDQRFNGAAENVNATDGDPTHGQDLDHLLSEIDRGKRALLGNTLAFAYEQLGRPDMAERARALTDLGPSGEGPAVP